jgi:hypothetical protein
MNKVSVEEGNGVVISEINDARRKSTAELIRSLSSSNTLSSSVNFNQQTPIRDPIRANVPQKWYKILLEILIPFFIAGLGMVGAGLFLDYVTVRLKMNTICFIFKN